jgi:two-component system phosphate regulon sensor histidine kinase PhoR
MIAEKKQELSVDAPEGLPRVSADSQMLRQAIINLLSNAVKYTPPGGQIKVSTYFENSRVCWQVKDTGIGIPRADLGKLFEKFYRARNALAVETEGTGLGLYLVKLIIERFGGNISCESKEGAGSTFTFALPVAA